MDDLISRQAALHELYHNRSLFCDSLPENFSKLDYWDKCRVDEIDTCIAVLVNLPSVQQWHVITKRPMTEEERKEWSERLGYDIEYDEAYIFGNLPDDGEEVFVSTQYGRVYIDTFCQDDGCYFEENGDMDGIVAWMPLPEPYKEEDNA